MKINTNDLSHFDPTSHLVMMFIMLITADVAHFYPNWYQKRYPSRFYTISHHIKTSSIIEPPKKKKKEITSTSSYSFPIVFMLISIR